MLEIASGCPNADFLRVVANCFQEWSVNKHIGKEKEQFIIVAVVLHDVTRKEGALRNKIFLCGSLKAADRRETD